MNLHQKMLSKTIGVLMCLLAGYGASGGAYAQTRKLTPMQERVEVQRQRLSSANIETRRDALMALAAMNHPDASRAAVSSLNDAEPAVRVTAVNALGGLPGPEAAAALLPLLQDKSEFVRREAAQALGPTRSKSATQPLIGLLTNDKESSVRAAAAIALGKIGDEAAVVPLVNILSGAPTRKKSKSRENEFVMRAAAQSLGLIRSRAGVASLIAALTNEQNPIDVRRAAAEALGQIGDASASPALKSAVDSADPYLADTARAALRRLK